MIYSSYMREKYRNTNVPRTAEGYPCILKKAKKGNIDNLIIQGNSGSKNLIPYPYAWFDGATEKTNQGVTFIDNGDGTVTANGTATADGTMKLLNSSIPVEFSHYWLSGVTGGSSATYYLQAYINQSSGATDIGNGARYNGVSNGKLTAVNFFYKKNTVFDNVLIAPQFAKYKFYKTDYTPYSFEKVGEIANTSENLINFSNLSQSTVKGALFETSEKGVITIKNGTFDGSSVAQYVFDSRNLLDILENDQDYILSQIASQYYISSGTRVPCQMNIVLTKNGTFVKNLGVQAPEFYRIINFSKITEEFDKAQLQILLYGKISDTLKFYPKLEKAKRTVFWKPKSGYYLPLIIEGKNLYNGYGFSANGIDSPIGSKTLSNSYGTTISTTSPSNVLTVTQSNIYDSSKPSDYRNGYINIGLNDDIRLGMPYRFTCDVNMLDNPLNVRAFLVGGNNQTGIGATFVLKDNKLTGNFLYTHNGTKRFLEIRNSGCSMELSNIMITPLSLQEYWNDYTPYEKPQKIDIFLDEPLGPDDYIDLKAKKLVTSTGQTNLELPDIEITKGEHVISVDTEIAPSNLQVKYIKY